MMTCTSRVVSGSTTPELGLTQYFLGFVVLTLKAILSPVGLCKESVTGMIFLSSKRKVNSVGSICKPTPDIATCHELQKKQGAQLSVSDQVQTIRILGHTAYRDSQQFVRWLLRCKPKDVYPSHNRLCTKRQLLLLDSLRKAF